MLYAEFDPEDKITVTKVTDEKNNIKHVDQDILDNNIRLFKVENYYDTPDSSLQTVLLSIVSFK